MKALYIVFLIGLLISAKGADTNQPPQTQSIVGVDKLVLGAKLPERVKVFTNADSGSIEYSVGGYTNHPPFVEIKISVDDDRRIYKILLTSDYHKSKASFYDLASALELKYGTGKTEKKKDIETITIQKEKRRVDLTFIPGSNEYEGVMLLGYEDDALMSAAFNQSWERHKSKLKSSAKGL